jgi:hypothetical protein
VGSDVFLIHVTSTLFFLSHSLGHPNLRRVAYSDGTHLLIVTNPFYVYHYTFILYKNGAF